MRIFTLLLSFALLTCTLPQSGITPVEEAFAKEEPPFVTVTRSNESWSLVLDYSKRSSFYQSNFLSFNLDFRTLKEMNLSLEDISFELRVDNGRVWLQREGDRDTPSWQNWPELYEKSYENQTNIEEEHYFVLKPEEYDMNFVMTANLTIYNVTAGKDNGTIYSEEHVFWIQGEPRLIKGNDPNQGIDLAGSYLKWLAISVLLMAGLLILGPRLGKKLEQRGLIRKRKVEDEEEGGAK